MSVEERLDATTSDHFRLARSIQEFRLDFLLEEEFACDLRFARSFVRACGKSGVVRDVLEVRQEVDLGPAIVDILVLLDVEREEHPSISRLALLIEDKITAGPAWKQASRYREVGEKHTGGIWQEFKTVLVAPLSYVGEREQFDAFVSLEQVTLWLCPDDPIRAEFRRRKIDEAIRKKNTTGVKVPDAAMLAFKRWYFDRLQSFNEGCGTDFCMPPPKAAYYAGDIWCEFTSDALPSFCKFRHKIRTDLKSATGKIEVAFQNTDFAPVKEPLRRLFGIEPIANGSRQQHVAIEVDVPEIRDVTDFDAAERIVMAAFGEALRFRRLICENTELIDQVVVPARLAGNAIIQR